MTSMTRERRPPSEAVAALLATLAIFAGAFELLYRPFRIAPVALVLLLVATIMSREQPRVIAIGYAVVGICFVVGAALQVLTHHPLF
ncbi:MAG: hypothetical protein ACJ77E_11310 [Gaiellaceae bacterium]